MIYRRHKNKYVVESDEYGKHKLYLGVNSEVRDLYPLSGDIFGCVLKVGDNTIIESIYVKGYCKIGSNCKIGKLEAENYVHIHNHVKIGYWVKLGTGVKILPRCTLEDRVEIGGHQSIIGPWVEIPNGTILMFQTEIRKSPEKWKVY